MGGTDRSEATVTLGRPGGSAATFSTQKRFSRGRSARDSIIARNQTGKNRGDKPANNDDNPHLIWSNTDFLEPAP
jgi:hypothetical protein